MPAKYPPYPYVEPASIGLQTAEIEKRAEAFVDAHHFRTGDSLDALCHAIGVDVEYSYDPNEVLLDVPLKGRPVIWLPKDGRKRQDRVTVAIALGYWTLHVESTRQNNPGCGIQALYASSSPRAAQEALDFGLAFLMPADTFRTAWYEGRAQGTAQLFDVPTKTAYDRAGTLLLTQSA